MTPEAKQLVESAEWLLALVKEAVDRTLPSEELAAVASLDRAIKDFRFEED